MQRFPKVTCVIVLVLSFLSFAHQEVTAGKFEIGTLFGLSHFSSDSGGETFVAAPSVPALYGSLGNPSLYVSWFPSERLEISPEFSFGRFSSDGDGITTLYLGTRGAFFPHSNAMPGPYIIVHGALVAIEGADVDHDDFSAGAGLGYQWRLGSAFVLRTEGRYRRWFDDEFNDFSFLLGLGTRAGGVGTHKDVPTREVEIGTLFGLSRRVLEFDTFFATETVTLSHIGVPAAPSLLFFDPARLHSHIPSLYILGFPNEKLSIGSEFSFGLISDAITALYVGGRGAIFLRSNTRPGVYILGLGAIAMVVESDESGTDISAGAGLGYQWRLGPAFVLRTEGQFRRWFKEGINDYSLLLGLGARLGIR